MITAAEPLFTTAGGHLITIGSHLEERRWRWFTWTCSCGRTSPAAVRWSHHDLAEHMALRHAEVTA